MKRRLGRSIEPYTASLLLCLAALACSSRSANRENGAGSGGSLATGGSSGLSSGGQSGSSTSTSGGSIAGAGASTTGGASSVSSGGSSGAVSGGSAGAGALGAFAGNGGAGGASAGSGGVANGGSSSAGASGGGVAGCKSGLLFCDDFESGVNEMPPPSPAWSVSLNGSGSVVIDGSTPAHSGSKSVHVSSNGGYQTFFVLGGAPVFPAPAPALYVRLFIRLGAPMTSGHNTYYKAGIADMSSSDHETRVGVMNGMLIINQPAGDRGFMSNQSYYNDGMQPGVVFPPLVWTCVEAFFDPPNSTFQIWVNGADVPDLHRSDWQQDPLGSFHFGFEKYAGPDADIWYDDIAVSTQPIGCQ